VFHSLKGQCFEYHKIVFQYHSEDVAGVTFFCVLLKSTSSDVDLAPKQSEQDVWAPGRLGAGTFGRRRFCKWNPWR